jgi:SAM-dependent methyltransferase
MAERPTKAMRDYWDEKARENAAWFVDTSLAYDDPNMEKFFANGEEIVRYALDGSPVAPAGHGLALEIGSGLGRICKALSGHFDRVIGVDISPEMVAKATDLVGSDKVTFRLGDGASLAGVDDASVDLVLSFTVFQHIPSIEVIEAYLREAGRVLKPGGVFVFQWNNTPGARRWAARRWLLSLLQRTGVSRERYGRHAPEFLGSRVPLGRVEAALASSGVKVRKTQDTGQLYAWAWASKD